MGALGCHLIADILVPVFFQLLIQGIRRAVRLVQKGQMLPATGKVFMDISGNLSQLLHKAVPSFDDLGSVAGQLHIPDLQRIHPFRMKGNVLEQLVALDQDLVVVGQIVKINLIKLT